MEFLKVLLFMLGSVIICESAFTLDSLKKCKVKDDAECHRSNFDDVLKGIPKNGMPELEIPPIDPVQFKDINVSILDLIDMTLIEGTAKGARNCIIHKFDVNIEDLRGYLELTCTLTVKSKYKMHSKSDLIKNLLGGEVRGDGNGKVKIEQIFIKLSFPMQVVKRGEDTFLQSDLKKYEYTFDVLGKVTFAADNLYLGEKESSQQLVTLLNDNWKTLLGSFGKHFFDIAMDFVYNFVHKFFSNVPTKYYIKDDLTPYVNQ